MNRFTIDKSSTLIFDNEAGRCATKSEMLNLLNDKYKIERKPVEFKDWKEGRKYQLGEGSTSFGVGKRRLPMVVSSGLIAVSTVEFFTVNDFYEVIHE